MTDNNELIERLRLMSPEYIGNEAADALESADKRVSKLEAALKMARELLYEYPNDGEFMRCCTAPVGKHDSWCVVGNALTSINEVIGE